MLILGLTTADARSKLAPSGPGGVPAEIPSTFVLRNALDRTTNKEYESETTEEELKRSVKFGLEKCNLFYGIDWIPVDSSTMGSQGLRDRRQWWLLQKSTWTTARTPSKRPCHLLTPPTYRKCMVPKESTDEAFPADCDLGDPGAMTTD